MESALRAYRKRNGWRLRDVGGLTGMSVSELSRVERGQRSLTPRQKVQVARDLGADVAVLFPRDERLEVSA